jgi:VWFA-related protein
MGSVHVLQNRSAAVAILVCLTGAPGFTQSGAAPAPVQQPPFKAGVNFVRVDVYPTRDGSPVMDLKAEEFEVQEDGAAQRIESFEHVVVRPAGPQTERIDPGSQRDALQAAANPRNRVFVIFLDTPHVSVPGAHAINEPLIRLVNRILGPDDLVAVMTPAMSASQIVLARKTQVIEDSLRRNWAWGDRFTFRRDEQEIEYEACYPETLYGDLATQMMRRKRERATLEAMQDLVRYLAAIREERKAILTVTEGWVRMGENPGLLALRENKAAGWREPVPGMEPMGVGPTGQPVVGRDPRGNIGGVSKSKCHTDRMRLASMDNQQFFRDLIADANRGNVSFYPIDPRGLPVFDTPIGPSKESLNVIDDRVVLRERHDAMHELALGTDGIAVMDNNDLDRGLKRIVDDLTSYYLIGYNSTNAKMDGRYRQIRVRVKRPGVDVRARKGYRAATPAELSGSRRAPDATPGATSSSAVTAALESLGRIRPDARFRINVAVSGAAEGTIWIAGEVQPAGNQPDDLSLGATADIEATAGGASGTARVTLKPGERSFLTPLKLSGAAGGQLEVRARFTPEGRSAFTDSIRVNVGPAVMQPLLFRRGATTGNRLLPAADFRFSRNERLRLEIPVSAGAKPGAGRVLDRMGNPVQANVTVGERVDADSGLRWLTADVSLAPFAPSDYAIEVAVADGGTEHRVVTAIRVTR